jgi:MFS family permease
VSAVDPSIAVASTVGLTDRQKVVLALILTGQFMAVLDGTIVTVALPTIRRDLGATGADLQLIVAGYITAYAVLLITGARLGLRFGFRTTFLSGLALFTVASLACGLAPTSGALIATRIAQGVGGALMVPQVFSLIQREFAGRARGVAVSAWGATLALGGVVGQVAGGILVTADLFGTGWRPVFLVNVPIGIALFVAGRRFLPADHPSGARPLDLAGLVTVATAVLLLVVPLVLGAEQGWPAWTILSLFGSALAFALFAWVERRVDRRGGSPLIAERVLRAPGFGFAMVAVVLALAALGGFLFTFTQHLQLGLGESALAAGLTFVPQAVAFAAASLLWQRLPARWHGRIIPIGCGAAAAGYALIAISVAGGQNGGLPLAGALVVLGLSQGLISSPMLTVALSGVAREDAADGSGVITTAVQLGLVLGVATFGSVFLSRAAVPGPHPTADAMTFTLGLITIAILACAAASVAMLRSQRSQPAVAGAHQPGDGGAAAAS